MSKYLPVTADEIAEAAIGAARAGAAVLHLHARDPEATGRPTQDPEVFMPFLPRIKAETDAIINITTGGSPHMTVQERMRPATTFKPELASLNMGSMYFGLFPDAQPLRQGHQARLGAHAPAATRRSLIFRNTYRGHRGA